MKLKYEKFDAIGNIRLSNPVSKTGFKVGDKVAQSPGNEFLPVHQFGTIIGNDDNFIYVKWDDGTETGIHDGFIQIIKTE
jgi:hypothetical protein